MASLLSLFKRRKADPHQSRFERLAKRLESPIEKRFWAHGYRRLSPLGTFTPQVPVGCYRLDFALTNIHGVELLKVAIEIDGHDYHSSPEQRDRDTIRDRALMRAGWQVIRFTGSQINRNVEGCVGEAVELVKEWARWLR